MKSNHPGNQLRGAIARSILGIGIALAGLTGLTGCTITDPQYRALASQIDRNPSPTAILGMWHRKDENHHVLLGTTSLHFNNDGTVFVKGKTQLRDSPVTTYRYIYVGSGVWTIANSGNVPWKLMLANGNLLQAYGLTELVFTRR